MNSQTFEQRASCLPLKESSSQHTGLSPNNKERKKVIKPSITFVPKWKLRELQKANLDDPRSQLILTKYEMTKQRNATHLFIQRVRKAEIRAPPFQGKNSSYLSRKFDLLHELKNASKMRTPCVLDTLS